MTEAPEYKDAGITLEIIPHVSRGGTIRLEIDGELTKVIDGATSTDVETPAAPKRQVQTVVSMQSGSTVAIGGLIRDDKVTTDEKVPLLGDVPVLGELFKSKKNGSRKTKRVIFITPYVLTEQQDPEQIIDKKKEMREAIWNN
jgi:general secretion pathway protein D